MDKFLLVLPWALLSFILGFITSACADWRARERRRNQPPKN